MHNRIQSQTEVGIIPRYNTTISLIAKPAVHILIFGTSKITSVTNLKPKLAANGSIYWLAVAGGNTFLIGAYLRDIAELDELVRFARETAEIAEPTVGITTSPIPLGMKMMTVKT